MEALDHDNIARILDVFTDDQYVYIVSYRRFVCVGLQGLAGRELEDFFNSIKRCFKTSFEYLPPKGGYTYTYTI